jgi:hypothetical protein
MHKSSSFYLGTSGNPKVDNYFIFVPPKDVFECRIFRDSKSLMTTADIPILARWLETGAIKYHEIISNLGEGTIFYTNRSAVEFASTLKSRSDHIVHSRQDLISRIINTYFDFRSALSNNAIPAISMGCDGQILKEAGKEPSQILWDFGARLKRPFNEKTDTILNALLSHNPRFISRLQNFFLLPELDNQPFCPFDGAIERPLNAFYFDEGTPSLEKEYQMTVCPHCLGVLYRS